MPDHFRAPRAFRLTLLTSRTFAVKSLPLLFAAIIVVAGSGCIGVSAKPAGSTAALGNPAAVKKCRAVRPAEDGAIDDLEDGDNQITKIGGRNGYWWSAADPNGSKIEMQTTEPGAGSEMSMRMTGKTAAGKPEDGTWGVQLGINFVNEGLFYDASKYAGIAFKAKVSPESGRQMRFKIGDINTHKDANVCKACWNHFGKDITLTPEWKEYQVTFSAAQQEPGWGDPRPSAITPSKLIALNWQVGPGQNYDVFIDDVTFLDCE